MPHRTGQGPTRRRGRALEQAIFDAVFAQLEASGYARFTMDAAAAAAGTGKSTLYRRWADKDELILDALYHALPRPTEVPLNGELRADLIAVLTCLRETFETTRGTAFQIVKSDVNPQAALVHTMVKDRVSDPCKQMVLDILARGAERGEVRPEAVSPLVANVGSAMMIHHSLTEGPVSDELLTAIVDEIVLPLVRLPPGQARTE